MVRAKGLEPPHLTILVPKTSASTNSATPARTHEAIKIEARPLMAPAQKHKRWIADRTNHLISAPEIHARNPVRAAGVMAAGAKFAVEEGSSPLHSRQ